MSKRIPTTVLISGGGTTLKNLIRHQNECDLPIDIGLVISSRPNVKGLEIAESFEIPTKVVRRRDFESGTAFRDANFDLIRSQNSQLVVMGGYLQHLLIPPDFENRVINIHPSLIPSFSGQGFYGMRVHRAAIEYGVKISGCTVHYVDDQYDHGPIILQRSCEVSSGDSAEELQKRVFELEKSALPDAIHQIADEIRSR